MKCPQCKSEDIGETNKFDLTLVDKEECQHDFECNVCGCLFNIVYAPIATKIVEKGTLCPAQ